MVSDAGVNPPTVPRHEVGADFETRWPSGSALATECVLNLASVAGQISAMVSYTIREAGLSSAAAANVLGILRGAGEPLLPSVIAERLVSTRGNVTQVLATLERRGLVRRLTAPKDRRRIPVEITADGIERVDAMQRLQHPADRRFMAALNEHEQRELRRLLSLLQARTDTPEDHDPDGR